MKTLVIQDIHLRTTRLKQIFNKHASKVDEIVLVGDYFDNRITDPILKARSVTEMLKMLMVLKDFPKLTLLLGNHDIQYWWRSAPKCHGYCQLTQNIIHDKVPIGIARGMFKFGHYTQGWLISHAGWKNNELPAMAHEHNLNKSLNLLGQAVFLQLEMGNVPQLVQYGRDRGGNFEHGGPLTRDWSSLPVNDNINQIVGHTWSKDVRINTNTDNTKANVCIDVGLDRLFWIDDGALCSSTDDTIDTTANRLIFS